MPHDDSKPCVRLFGPMGKYHMMAPFFIHMNKTLPWSPCSAVYLTELLDDGHGMPHSAPLDFSHPSAIEPLSRLLAPALPWGLPAAVLSHKAHRGGERLQRHVILERHAKYPPRMLFLAPIFPKLSLGLT